MPLDVSSSPIIARWSAKSSPAEVYAAQHDGDTNQQKGTDQTDPQYKELITLFFFDDIAGTLCALLVKVMELFATLVIVSEFGGIA